MHFIKHSQPQDGSRQANKPRPRVFRNSLLYAEVAGALALGWLAFQPMVSRAQEKPRQEKTAPVPLPVSASNQLSFSDAQMHSTACPAYDSTHQYAGARRILIELESQPEGAQQLARRYVATVDSIASILRDSLNLGPQDESETGRALVDILYHKVKRSDADTTLAASFLLNLYNCERLSMFERDILEAVGIPSELVAVEDKHIIKINGRNREETIGHVLVQTPSFIIDGVKNAVYAKEDLFNNYRIVYGVFSDAGTLQYSTYFALGNCMAIWGRHEPALFFYEKAAKLAPGIPFIFYNMGNEYYAVLELEKSINAYDKVLELDPNFAKGIVPFLREIVHSCYIQEHGHAYAPDGK